MNNEPIWECIGCGRKLTIDDFLVHDKKNNVTICIDCYNLPEWYELINI